MFRPLKGHHQAFCLKQFFKILRTLLGSHLCLQIIGRPLRPCEVVHLKTLLCFTSVRF